MSTLILEDSYLDTLNNIERKKHTQKIKIVKQLYIKGPKTNSDLCSDFNISSPTSMGLLSELMTEGLVEKKGRGKSEGGRKPDLYGLRANSLFVLSIAMGRFKTRMAIFDNNNNNITGVQTFPVCIAEGVTAADQLQEYAESLISNSGIDPDKLMGVGVSMPGLVASKEGNNYTYMHTAAEAESLQQLLTRKFNKPVYIQNDSKSAALAEYRFGLAKGRSDVLVLSLDWGVGLGVIMDGKLRSGTKGFAGEIGHIPLENNGALCYCGKRGCLETVASGIALANMAKEGIKSGQHSLLNELSDQKIDSIEPKLVIDAANRGDQYAINILSKIGMNLGKGISILIQIFNPELIILGGRIAEAKQYITTPIQQSINTYCMAQLREKTEIALSNLGQNAGILGSVAVVMENIFEDQLDLD
ncbi:ROK family transcriptional regulator [Pontibacter harenae]|uniref:ROK family transcriptional regulator n=1 Tax=Pontibacter harenae TaxID=2894083 RepID=UPI001E2866CA|nr:ROK family transcriptional regulator [Pontibacter harenae]MCC9168431.1 ROK family transcriptional regulator [Pontibacter harenae]